jgi:hypothetical protein
MESEGLSYFMAHSQILGVDFCNGIVDELDAISFVPGDLFRQLQWHSGCSVMRCKQLLK